MSKVYIVIKEYNEELSKRQPWYSIKKLILDLEKQDCNVEVINSLATVPQEFDGVAIKVFGIKDLLFRKSRNYKLYYLMTFPVYGVKKFFSIPLKTTIENWSNLKRIFIISLIPKFILKFTLQKVDKIIVISDRSEKYLSTVVDTQKYIPFIFDNWNGVKKGSEDTNHKKTIGYFGPPFTTRSFDEVVEFFYWLNSNNFNFDKKIITRIERDELKDIEDKYLSKIQDDKSLKIVSGFLNRKSLANELLDIDVLILPFKIVMSELPIVVLEALELGIPIITTEDSGIENITKGQTNILVLENLKKDKFSIALEFIRNVKNDDFNKIKNNIENINAKTLEILCQK